MTTALFPGSFDPITNGHLDVIKRALRLFDKIIIAVAINKDKGVLFSMEEREQLLLETTRDYSNVEVICFEGLLVDAVKKYKASAVIRGLRAISDFEYEFQMAMMNRELNDKCETIFLMPSPAYSFLSSRMIKEIAQFGGEVSSFVPQAVIEAMKKKKSD